MIYRFLMSIVLAIALSFSLFTSVVEAANKEAFHAGIAAFQQEKYSEAIEQFNQAILQDPNFAPAYSDRCLTYLNLENYLAALIDCTQALKLNPNHIETYLNRGLAHYKSGELAEAIADYSQVLQLKPHDYRAYYNRGLAEADLAAYREAIVDYGQAIRQTSPLDRLTLAEIYSDRGLAQLLLTHHEGAVLGNAIADFTEAIQFNKASIRSYYNRGCAYHQKGNRIAALEDFNQVLARDPSYTQAYVSRGLLRQEMGEMGGAIADLRQAATSFNQQGAKGEYQQVLRLIEKMRSVSVAVG
jgi:tetratricopeptide (TPR) repeat protein